MADLKALLAKQKAKANAESTSSASGTAPESSKLPPAEAAASPAPERPANPFAKRGNLGSGDSRDESSGGTETAGGNDSGNQQPRPKLAALSVKSESRDTGSDTGGVAPLTLDSLDALDASEEQGLTDRPSLSSFADETPANAPTRELPADMTAEQLGFIGLIDGIYGVLHEPELLGQAIRSIMIELKSNPEYMKLVADEDIRTWVRGMRDSMGLAKIRKTETKAKRAGGAGKKSKLVDDDMLKDLDELGISIPGVTD